MCHGPSSWVLSLLYHSVISAVERLCEEAITYGFGAVCVAPIWVAPTCAILASRNAAVTVASVVGFPHGTSFSPSRVGVGSPSARALTTVPGTSLPEVKALEARLAVLQGAREIDLVLNVSVLKAHAPFLADVAAVVRAVQEVAHELHLARDAVLVKVILETALLSDEEKVRACQLCERAGAHMVKTSTGFASGGATEADVALMRKSVGDRVGVKASGGIRTLDDALKMLRAGASRLGCSAGVQIIKQWRERKLGQAHPDTQDKNTDNQY